MGVKTGIVTGSELKKNRNGQKTRLMLQVQMTNADDIQTVEYVPLPGTDANPIKGSRVYILTVDNSYKIAVAINDGVTPETDPGERHIYAVNDDGVIQSFIKLLKTGVIRINGDADFAVRFDALDQALQLYVNQVNAALGNKLDGAGTAGLTALDISAAKVDNVKLP